MAGNDIVCTPPEERGGKILERNEELIVQLMDPELIARLLEKKGVIDYAERKKILQPRSRGDRIRALVDRIKAGGSSAYNNFMDSLNETDTENHDKLMRILLDDDPIPKPLLLDQRLHDNSQKRLQQKIVDLEHRLKDLEKSADVGSSSDVESIHYELVDMRRKLKEREDELQKSKEENRLLHKRIASMELHTQGLEERLKKLAGDKETVRAEVKRKNKEIDEMRKELSERETALQKVTEENRRLQERVRLLDEKSQRLESKLEDLTKSQKSTEEQVHELMKRVNGLEFPKNSTNRTLEPITPRNRFQTSPPKPLGKKGK